jgi:hypothetical protein
MGAGCPARCGADCRPEHYGCWSGCRSAGAGRCCSQPARKGASDEAERAADLAADRGAGVPRALVGTAEALAGEPVAAEEVVGAQPVERVRAEHGSKASLA